MQDNKTMMLTPKESRLQVANSLDATQEGMAFIPSLIFTQHDIPEGYMDTFPIPDTVNRIVAFKSDCPPVIIWEPLVL